MRSGLITIVIAVTLTACSGKDKSTAAATAADSPAAASEAPVAAASSPGDPTAEISSYSLDMDKMNRWMGVMKTIESNKDSSLKSQVNLGDDKTVDISVSRLESIPVASAAFKANGISARDFVMTTLAYMQASMTAGMLKSVPNYKVPAGMNMKNVDFMKQHGAEIEKNMKAMGAGQDN